MKTHRVAAAIVMVAAALTTMSSMAGADDGGLSSMRRATAKYHRLEVATHAGYGPFSDINGLTCIEDPGGAGAMGVHYVNGGLVGDGLIDATKPEALLYDLSGKHPRLLGAEYIVVKSTWGDNREPPSLFGQEFELQDSPNRYDLPPFYELHVWSWQHNPAGTFEDWNPNVDC